MEKKQSKTEKEKDNVVIPRERDEPKRKSFCDSQMELGEFFSNVGVKVVAVDMPPLMQIHAITCARKAYDDLEKCTSKTLAFTLKKVLLTNRASIGVSGHTQPTTAPSLGVTASPSRFAPPGHQGHSANLPTLSVSGTHYVISSPSPAGSGGTSVFRDARLTSPSWN